MSRRRLLLAVLAFALLGVAGFTFLLWLTTPAPGVSLENFRGLRLGMSKRKWKSYSADRASCDLSLPDAGGRTKCAIYLYFDADGLKDGEAHSYPGCEHIRRLETFIDRIRRWLHW